MFSLKTNGSSFSDGFYGLKILGIIRVHIQSPVSFSIKLQNESQNFDSNMTKVFWKSM